MGGRKASELKVEFVKQGLVQADVAIDSGIGETRLSRILNGRIAIREDERTKLARVLGIPAGEVPI